MLVWLLITLFIFILLTPQHEGFKKPKKPNLKKIVKKASTSVANTANKVGSAVSKLATAGLPQFVRNVLKHIGPIKKSLASFIKKEKNDASNDEVANAVIDTVAPTI